MARGRQRFEGQLICYLIAWIPDAVWSGKPIDPEQINPWQEAPAKTPEMERFEKWQAKTRWRAMLMGLKQEADSRGHQTTTQ